MSDIPCPRCDGDYPDGCHFCHGIGRAPEIVGVALKLVGSGEVVSLPRPKRHHDVIRLMNERHYPVQAIARAEQGFITNHGDFVNRRAAKDVAAFADQLIRDSSGGSAELYSEDVW